MSKITKLANEFRFKLSQLQQGQADSVSQQYKDLSQQFKDMQQTTQQFKDTMQQTVRQQPHVNFADQINTIFSKINEQLKPDPKDIYGPSPEELSKLQKDLAFLKKNLQFANQRRDYVHMESLLKELFRTVRGHKDAIGNPDEIFSLIGMTGGEGPVSGLTGGLLGAMEASKTQ